MNRSKLNRPVQLIHPEKFDSGVWTNDSFHWFKIDCNRHVLRIRCSSTQLTATISLKKKMERKNEENEIRFSNPFTLKVGQVFTGFGIGCGVGIGVGRPLNLGTTFPSSLPISHYHGFRKKLVQTQTSPKFPCSKTMYLFLPFPTFFFFFFF